MENYIIDPVMSTYSIMREQMRNLRVWLESITPDALNALGHLSDLISEQVDMRPHSSLYFTAIGKNIPMLQKVVSTMNSFGIKAYVLDAVNALHGDIGVIKYDDYLIGVSHSGNTQEVVTCLEYAKRNGLCTTIGVALVDDTQKTRFDAAVKFMFKFGAIDEVGEWNLAPTTSPLAFQLIFDAVAFCAAGRANFGRSDYKINHPAGDIGKTLLSTAE